MRKKNRLLSLLMVFIFAVAFLAPSMSMPATAMAKYSSDDTDVVTGSADVDDDVVTLWAEIDNGDSDFDEIDELDVYGFFWSEDRDEVEAVEDAIRDGDVPDGDWLEGTDDSDTEFYAELDRLFDLDDDTTYYYVAYIEYDGGDEAACGSIKSFNTDSDGPDGSDRDGDGDLSVVTDDADDIDGDEATLTAYVDDYDEDDYDITESGFFWGDDESDVEDVEDYLEDGDDDWNCEYDSSDDENDDSDEFEFSLDLTDLDEGEYYYYRGYIEYEDDDGDLYYALGDVERFEADEDSGSDKPKVLTNAASDIDSDSAVLNGTIDSFGDDDEITEYGFYYGTTSTPTTKKMVGDDEDNIDEGDDFDYTLTGLNAGTTYYFRAYAKNSEGLAYGTTRSFKTTGSIASNSVFTIGQNYYLLNGQYQAMDAAPYIKNSRTYMPIRYVGYAMGLTDSQIQWYEATRTVILTKGGTTVVLVIGSNTMFVNGVARTLDVAPEISNSRTCLPIAWVAAAFGHTAVWNGSTQQVTISGVTASSSVSDEEYDDEDSSGEVTVATNSATRIDEESARLNGKVTDDGGLDIEEFGFYYGTDRDDVEDGDDGDADVDEARGNASLFYLDIDDLDDDTRYYFMAYAIDEDDNITYGSVKSFTTKED